jgi:hypothetical protein
VRLSAISSVAAGMEERDAVIGERGEDMPNDE